MNNVSITAFEEIKAMGALPSPTGTELRIPQIEDRDATPVAEITSVVESDPSLAGRLTQLVNSPWSF